MRKLNVCLYCLFFFFRYYCNRVLYSLLQNNIFSFLFLVRESFLALSLTFPILRDYLPWTVVNYSSESLCSSIMTRDLLKCLILWLRHDHRCVIINALSRASARSKHRIARGVETAFLLNDTVSWAVLPETVNYFLLNHKGEKLLTRRIRDGLKMYKGLFGRIYKCHTFLKVLNGIPFMRYDQS